MQTTYRPAIPTMMPTRGRGNGRNGGMKRRPRECQESIAGRLTEVLAKEGDFVTAGQVPARMDTDVLKAELSEAWAELRRAGAAIGEHGLTSRSPSAKKGTPGLLRCWWRAVHSQDGRDA